MPKLTITPKEIFDFTPRDFDKVQYIQSDGNEIQVCIKIPITSKKNISIQISIQFLGYSNDLMTLKIKSEKFIGEKFISFSKILKIFSPLSDEKNIEIDSQGKMKINVNPLIHKHYGDKLAENGFDNLKVDNIQFNNNKISIQFSI